jgi:hypothetical protein
MSRRGHPVYKENPSVVGGFPVTMRSRSRTNDDRALLITHDTGEIISDGTFTFVSEEEVDNERFIKIYLAGIKEHGNLTKAGATLFEFVYYQLSGPAGKDRDTVAMNLMIVQDWKSMAKATYYRGLNELLERGFIFRTMAADVYFINVRFMFNGDRMIVANSYRRKKPTKAIKKPVEQQLLFAED